MSGGRGVAAGSGLSAFLMAFGAGVVLIILIDGARKVSWAPALPEELDVVRDAAPQFFALLELLVSVPILLWVTVRIVASAVRRRRERRSASTP